MRPSKRRHIILIAVTLPIVLIFLLLWSSKSFASLSADDLRSHKENGQSIARSIESNVAEVFKDMETHELKEIVGYEGSNVRGAGMSIEQAESSGEYVKQQNDEKALKELLGEPVEYTCEKTNCEVGHTFSSLSVIKRQEELEKQGFEKDENGMPINNLGYLDKALSFAKNNNEFDFLSDATSTCQSSEEKITTHTEKTCDQYYDLKTNSCFPKQIVEIDPEYKYACNKIREEKIKTCREEITSITCKDSHECDLGGIEPGTVASDMKYVHEGGILTIGTIADNYWPGNCGVYDRSTTFNIKNKDKIKEFTLSRVGFDDYMQIILNDKLIYIGPDGGNKLEVKTIGSKFWKTKVVDNGYGHHACERGVSWDQQPNIDLKPHLKEGENILKTRVIVGGVGEGWLQIRAKQNCCSKWDIKREEKCDIS